MKTLPYILATVGVFSIAALVVLAQTARDQGAPSVRTFGLSAEQGVKIREAAESLGEMRELTDKLAAARKEAIEVALRKDATLVKVRAKVEAVAKIQTEIAVLRYNKGVKGILQLVTDEQKAQMLEIPGMSYNQLFVGNSSGLDFVRGGRFMPKDEEGK